MIQTNRKSLIVVLLLYLQTTSLKAGPSSSQKCPIGFQEAVDSDNNTICFQKKERETFADKSKNCAGNLYTFESLRNFNITTSDGQSIWTDYKTSYDGGPFVNCNNGETLPTTYDVKRGSTYNIELCVVMDPTFNLTAVRCDEKHHRYCFLKTYDNLPYNKDCDGDDEVWFPGPIPACLKRKTRVRMTWNQSLKACKSRDGYSLLNHAWIYSNYPDFNEWTDTEDTIFPLGIQMSENFTSLRYVGHENSLIPSSQWRFESKDSIKDTILGAVSGDSWELVNSSYTFYDVLCEKNISQLPINLTVSIDPDDDQIVLSTNAKSIRDIFCFTDSTSYAPQKVKLIPRRKPGYILKFINDGYYWCIQTNSENFYTIESNKVLRIKVKADTETLYAVKLTSLAHDYTLADIDEGKLVSRVWKKKIEEYVSYATKWGSMNSFVYDNKTLWSFRNSTPVDIKSAEVTLKRIYLNARTALLHVKLHPRMLPVRPGEWDDIRIDSMKPAYYCGLEAPLTKKLALGEVKRVSDCKIYKCTGDFNEGVQLVITAEDTCRDRNASTTIMVEPVAVTDIMPTAFAMTTTMRMTTTTMHYKHGRPEHSESSSEEDYRPIKPTTVAYTERVDSTINHTVSTVPEVAESSITTEIATSYLPVRPPTVLPPPPTAVEPTTTSQTPVVTGAPTFPPASTTPPPPSQHLENVMQSLEQLLNNTQPVVVADIEQSFDEMDLFLDDQTGDLDIPSHLLHLLDELGGRLYLEGASNASAVRENVALLVADADQSDPVRGLRIATRENDSFVAGAFEIIRDEINDTQLDSDANEVVISLPDSVATDRRISFVVFRNDRAFRNNGLYSVNSRILSVNIENTTRFSDGEVIDIHLSPLDDTPERNESRACAFWQFLEDGSGGFWSEEGCTFIKATTAGMLDTCRCNHLTHFAEVLVPRTVFSERNENALEVISAVGCVLSLIGVICVGITALMFRAWRRDYSNKIWLQLCISIFILSLSFLVVIYASFEPYEVMCMLIGIVLHFSVLSSFCWMLVAAVLSYRRLVTVFTRDASHKLLRASAFAWGVPCAVIGILLSVAPHSYSGRFDEKNPSTAFCYPSGLALWLSVYAPIAVMLLVNWTLFALIVRSVFASRRNHPNRIGNRHSSDREALRCASVSFFLVFLFGLPWLFGLFAMTVVMAYIFVLLTTFQGFVLFLFFVLGNKKTRDLWLNKLKIKQTKTIPVTTSTYANNRSTSVNASSGNGHKAETIEAKVSKPKSLSSSDNSRFS